MNTPKMKLPHPAKDLWRRLRAPLRRVLREYVNHDLEWTLGGATVLAARWGHRESTDIDLSLENTNLMGLHPHYGHEFSEAMEEAGATGIDIRSGGQVVVMFPTGRLDLTVSQETNEERQSVVIDGYDEFAYDNSHILYKKLKYRSMRSPVRDLFDFAVAGRVDREALEVALDTQETFDQREVTARWANDAERYKKEAAKGEIRNVAESFASIAEDPAPEAIETFENIVCMKYSVFVHDGVVHAKRHAADSHVSTHKKVWTNRNDIRQWLESKGALQQVHIREKVDPTRLLFELKNSVNRD